MGVMLRPETGPNEAVDDEVGRSCQCLMVPGETEQGLAL